MNSKLFVFITPSIVNIGGAQLYIARKKGYLESLGWKVLIISCIEGEIIIPNLKDSMNVVIPMLKMPFNITNKSRRAKIKRRIVIPAADLIVVEANTIALSIWSEYIFDESSIKKICYPLSEQFPSFSKDEINYLCFKLKQKLLYGITPKSIPMILGENLPYDTWLKAIGCRSNIVDDITNINIRIPKADYTILSLGRLDKPYIPYAFASVRKFASENKYKRINLILVGDNNYNVYRDFSVEEKNLNVIKTGALFPIPRTIFQNSNVAIASAGCVSVCTLEGVPTIVVDANDYKAIGIFKQTTNNSMFREQHEPQIEIVQLLNEVLIENKYKNITEMPDVSLDYSKHLEIIEQPYDNPEIWFDVTRMKISFKKRCIRIFYFIFGFNLLNKIFELI